MTAPELPPAVQPDQVHKKYSPKAALLIGLVLLLVVFVSIVAQLSHQNSHASSAPLAVIATGPSTNSLVEKTPPQVKIEGLFGVKLGEPVPPACQIKSTGDTAGGIPSEILIPPETNSTFDTYVVYLDASRQFVSMVSGQSIFYKEQSDFEQARDGIVSKLRERYGKEEFEGGPEMYWYKWTQGNRDITLTEIPKTLSFDISCKDKDLYDSVEKSKPAVDARGL